MNANATSTVALVVVFAALVTLHVATLFGLAVQRHYIAALGGLILPPIAPFAAFRSGMPKRAIAWILLAVLYAVLFYVAS